MGTRHAPPVRLGLLRETGENNPRIGRSGNDPISLLNAGECVAGTGPACIATVNAKRGNPIGIVYPDDGTVLCVGPSVIVASAPHPNTAKLFLEWLLSADYAATRQDWSREPVRADAERCPASSVSPRSRH